MISSKKLYVQDDSDGFRYTSNQGVFFTYDLGNKCVEYAMECREEFHGDYFSHYNRYVGFFISNLNLGRFSRFFNYIETKLKIKNKDKSTLHRVMIGSEYEDDNGNPNYEYSLKKNVVIIKVSRFWLKNETSRQLFTLLIRLGAKYYTGNFKKAILKYDLARDTKYAINRFLSGYNKQTFWGDLSYNQDEDNNDVSYGWYAKFADASKEQIRELLVKP